MSLKDKYSVGQKILYKLVHREGDSPYLVGYEPREYEIIKVTERTIVVKDDSIAGMEWTIKQADTEYRVWTSLVDFYEGQIEAFEDIAKYYKNSADEIRRKLDAIR